MDNEHIESVVTADLKRANSYYEETIEPLLMERRDLFMASEDYYQKLFPWLSAKSNFRSFDFYAYVQWAKSPILQSFFGTSKVVSVTGMGPEDEKSAQAMEKLINWQVSCRCGGYLAFRAWVEDALKYELGFLKCWWQRSVDVQEHTQTLSPIRVEMLRASPDVQILEVGSADYFGDCDVKYTTTVVTENRPVLDNVSPFDMRWSPEARNLDGANFVAQRQVVSAHALLRGVMDGEYDSATVDEVIEQAGRVSHTMAELTINPELENSPDEESRGRRQVELYECYVNIDSGDGLLSPMIVTVANDKVIKAVPNTFGRLPFFMLAPHLDPAKVMPDVSTAEILGELQSLRVAIVRQLVANLSLSNRPRVFVNELAVNIDDLIGDKTLVRCNDNPHGVVMPEQPTNIAGWTMNFMEYLKGVEEEWTSKTRYNQGMDAASLNQTATGITAIMQAANSRINQVIRDFAETGFSELNRFLVFLNQSYMDDNQMIRVFGVPLNVAPDDIRGNLDITVNVDVGLGDRQQTLNALMLFIKDGYPMAAQIGASGSGDLARAMVRFLELSGLRDAQTYIRSPEEVMAVQEQRMQQQEQMAQADTMARALLGGGGSGGESAVGTGGVGPGGGGGSESGGGNPDAAVSQGL